VPYDIRTIRDNNLALVAAGRLDAFWELKLGPWDVATGCLMVEEAGGAARRTPPAVPWTSIRRQSSRPTARSTARSTARC
jgi:fructose-1,6-bisphosphatase/inositol monophosphatase family enzyme